MSSFHEVRFPEAVSEGSSGGPQFKTDIFISHKGYEKRNVNWSQPQMRFNVAYGIRTDVDMMEVLEFFTARQGMTHGFRYKNWNNFRIVNGPIAVGDGVNTRLPIYKVSGFVGAQHYKRLRKIVRGSVSGVTQLGSPIVEGVDYNIDYDNGEIILNGVLAFGVPIYGSLEFDEPVMFEQDSVQAIIDAYNSNSLNNLSLVGLKSEFYADSVFAPNANPTYSDTFFENVNLILNFDDVDVPTTTIDQSALANPVTINGDGLLTTALYKHGRGSFDTNTNGYISVSGTPFDLSGNVLHSLELFLQKPISGDDQQPIIGKWDETSSARCWILRYNHAVEKLQYVISTDGIAETIILNYPWVSPVNGSFDYLTVDYLSSGWYVLRINGAVVQYIRNLSSIYDTVTPLIIGNYVTPGVGQGPYQGLIDSVRVTVGRTRNRDLETIEIPSTYAV